jgi:GNAT superfamily N-acetyltransferase
MASIEAEGDTLGRIEPLGVRDLADGVRLSVSALWNQNESDWRTMLALGQGWGIRAAVPGGEPRLAASTVVLPYGDALAWVSMVLVLPEFRRRGYATQLLRHALACLGERGCTAVLDATPLGHPVYVQEGFVDTWAFARYARQSPIGAPPSAPPSVRPLHETDWPAVAALDSPAFGADRSALLRALATRLPQAAWVLERDGRVVGWVLGRDGREAGQIGPLIAPDAGGARDLIDAVLAQLRGPVMLDLTDRHRDLLPWLHERGFAYQRPFTRMVYGGAPGGQGSAAALPGDPSNIVLVAGPELG